MNRLIVSFALLSLLSGAAAVQAADDPGRSGDPASAEKRAPGAISAPDKGKPMKEAGRSGDPASAEKRQAGTLPTPNKGDPVAEPGRSNDPASAEKADGSKPATAKAKGNKKKRRPATSDKPAQ